MLEEYQLNYLVAIRSNHRVLMASNQRVRANKWHKFERVFSNQTSETRYIREIIFGKKRSTTYWEITTDPVEMPGNSTSFVMTNLKGKIKPILGNLYGLRTWVEYGFRQCKQELGWTDYRLTNFAHIEKWWETIFSIYLMITLNSPVFLETEESQNTDTDFSNHEQWNHQTSWKNVLNNLRLIVQPIILLWLIEPWLDIFPNSNLLRGFHQLIHQMNQFQPYFPDG